MLTVAGGKAVYRVGTVVRPAGKNYLNSLVLGYGHAWVSFSRVRLQPFKNLKLDMGGMDLVVHAIVVVTIG